MQSSLIREKFFSFFRNRSHTKVKSDNLLSSQDPTLLFTNAGMVPFKHYWLENEKVPYETAVSIQKCLRAGGKKSDLENVGRTKRHHTFFEMMGNFSFGKYFKEEAIDYAWDFFKTLDLPLDLLWVSVYETDDEAFDLWLAKGIPKERMVRLGKEDNFWGPAGATGVCGPCSEIHIDLPAWKDGQEPRTVFTDEDDIFLELWNLVFVQLYQDEKQEQRLLSRKGIDTGMGLERLAYVLQDVPNTYMTDLFSPALLVLENVLKKRYDPEDASHYIFHVISDHARALMFALAEDLTFSSEGRGYVLRRLLRRIVQKTYMQGISTPFLSEVISALLPIYIPHYPECAEGRESILARLKEEEENGISFLESSLTFIEPFFYDQKKKSQAVISGKDIFFLYDTHGIPLDFIEDMALEKGLDLDKKGFEDHLLEQKKRSRGAREAQSWKEELFSVGNHYVASHGEQRWSFYDQEETVSSVVLLWKKNNGYHDEVDITQDEDIWLILNENAFYAESGGQVSDRGYLKKDGQIIADVFDVKKINPYCIALACRNFRSSLSCGEMVSQVIDQRRREAVMRSHTVTHILHAVLRDLLGDEVRQMGSLVDEDRLRFDFSYSESLKGDILSQIEHHVNQVILSGIETLTKEMSFDEAKAEGALSFFDEKYGELVRCVRIGDVSVELCGGTHLRNTSDALCFEIVKTSSVAAGVRRIEAWVGHKAYDSLKKRSDELKQVSSFLNIEEGQVFSLIKQMKQEMKSLKKGGEQNKKYNENKVIDDIQRRLKNFHGLECVVFFHGESPEYSQNLADHYCDLKQSGVLFLVGYNKGRCQILIFVSADYVAKKVSAKDIFTSCLSSYQARGGGRPDRVQGGFVFEGTKDELENVLYNSFSTYSQGFTI